MIISSANAATRRPSPENPGPVMGFLRASSWFCGVPVGKSQRVAPSSVTKRTKLVLRGKG
ncbi:polyketide synthase [Aspergillus luchuensis]|uniref:Polyketide synthase n=1 Tax=Aspergillus kawachii TaxID=1069201 RepID=A0A146FMK7_ASPKA|nr:polyketide synthase [Aspergillus luchuensis]